MLVEYKVAVIKAATEMVKLAHSSGCDDIDKLAADFEKAHTLLTEIVKRSNTPVEVEGVGIH